MNRPPPLPSGHLLQVPAPTAPSPLPVVASANPPFVRDRIVVLGRTKAGKTIYIARLYHELWSKPQEWFSMRALDGIAHTSIMTMCGELANGRWPAATTGQRYIDCELKFNSTSHRLTILDYPGEVFSKAFVRGESDTEDTITLLEHVDHARGVILLIDPQNAVDSRDPSKRADDDYGMTAVVDRIRKFPGGESVPIAIVLTKCDIHQSMILSLGGVKEFVKDYLLWITRTAGLNHKVFCCAAIRLGRSRRTGGSGPDLSKPPLNVVEPLRWILEKLESGAVRVQLVAAKATEQLTLNDTVQRALSILDDELSHHNCSRASEMLSDLPSQLQEHPLVRKTRATIA